MVSWLLDRRTAIRAAQCAQSPLSRLLRGLLIYLVTVGHSLQYLVLWNQNYFSDGLFKFIYMFHMPLFMVISGYVASPSIRRMSFGAS